MKSESSRREFLKVSAAACAAPLAGLGYLPGTSAGSPSLGAARIRKAVLISMLPKQLSYGERFKLARDAGYEGVEAQTVTDPRVAEEIKKAAEDAGIRIHSVMNMARGGSQPTSGDPEVVKKSLEGLQLSLRNAKFWGADTVLVVPGVVNPETTYAEAWTRSQEQIRKLIPLAEELKVVLAIEEVWNRFLLSPLEFPKYVDEFRSPWVKAYFDVGNVLLYGYPQDWIHSLGKRIVKVHLKDFKRLAEGYRWVNLGDGDVDWPAVRKAFADIGYTGYATTELDGGDAAYLRDVSQRVDRLVLGL
jgi:L-ribulose-5-phosphate 3-epimerase